MTQSMRANFPFNPSAISHRCHNSINLRTVEVIAIGVAFSGWTGDKLLRSLIV
jgi:hypothetical protein